MTPIVALNPWPGTRARIPATVSSAPKPTAGSSHDQERLPASARIARPINSEATQITSVAT